MDDSSRYELVSSFYGPGAVGCWLLTLCSVFVSWLLNPRNGAKDTIINDYIAALAFPAVAAFHFMYQLGRLPSSIKEIYTTENADLIRYAAAIEAPVVVCRNFNAFAVIFFTVATPRRHWKRAGTLLIIGMLSLVTRVIFFVQAPGSYLYMIVIGAGMVPWATAFLDGPRIEWLNLAFVMILLQGTLMEPLIRTGSNSSIDMTWDLCCFPRTSASIRDLDQSVALAAGIITLGFSIYDAYKAGREHHHTHLEQTWQVEQEHELIV